MTEDRESIENDLKLAWLAGFMEGDGGYQINVKAPQLRIAASQSIKNKLNLDAMELILNKNKIYHKR